MPSSRDNFMKNVLSLFTNTSPSISFILRHQDYCSRLRTQMETVVLLILRGCNIFPMTPLTTAWIKQSQMFGETSGILMKMYSIQGLLSNFLYVIDPDMSASLNLEQVTWKRNGRHSSTIICSDQPMG